MIDIIEKDGATIITIENPTPTEAAVIKKAQNAYQFSSSKVWSKFKCNQKNNCDLEKPIEKDKQTQANLLFEEFEVIGDDNISF